jgi:hypothetical protein
MDLSHEAVSSVAEAVIGKIATAGLASLLTPTPPAAAAAPEPSPAPEPAPQPAAT